MKIPTIIGLVDFSHGLTVQQKATASDAGPNDAGRRFIQQLSEFRQMCDGTVVLCLDHGPYWRKGVFPGYKEGRERDPEYEAIYRWTLERVQADGYQVASVPGEEADDIVATLATAYAEEGCEDIRIFTHDKDACSLINDVTRVFVPKGRSEFEIRDVDYVINRYGVKPEQMALFLAICGDPGDRIPGIKGIGEKGAAKLIQAYGTPAGMAVACVAQVEAAKVTNKLPAFWRNYSAGMAELPKWIKLTTLNREAKLEKPALAYLEKLPMQKLVEEPSDADDSEFNPDPEGMFDPVDWDAIAAETEARERAELAAALPVDPPKPEPRMSIGDDVIHAALKEADRKRERSPEQVAADNAKEASRVRPDGRTQAQALEDARLDRHGQERPKAQSAPGAVSSGHQAAASAGSQNAGADSAAKPIAMSVGEFVTMVEQVQDGMGIPKTPAATNGAATATPSAPAASAAPAAAEVVPRTTGPRKASALDEPPMAEIVPYAPPNWALSTQPASAGHAFAISVKLHNSRRWMGRHDSPEQIAAVILRGRELGIGMMTALDAFHVIQGRVCASSQLISALAENDPNHEYTMLVELDDNHAVVEIKHKKQPKPVRWEYTIGEAEALGLLLPSKRTGEQSQWVKRPKTMLAKTARANGHRFMFPGSTLGLHSLETESDGQHLVSNDD